MMLKTQFSSKVDLSLGFGNELLQLRYCKHMQINENLTVCEVLLIFLFTTHFIDIINHLSITPVMNFFVCFVYYMISCLLFLTVQPLTESVCIPCFNHTVAQNISSWGTVIISKIKSCIYEVYDIRQGDTKGNVHV